MLHKKGFTLIELLIVIGIIGLLSTVAVVSLNSSRAKGRDAKRIADVKSLQSALEVYFNDQNAYPTASGVIGGTAAADLKNLCGVAAGFQAAVCGATTTYMSGIPANPTPNGTAYTYTPSGTPPSSYTLTFTLENNTGSLLAGLRTASPSGVQ